LEFACQVVSDGEQAGAICVGIRCSIERAAVADLPRRTPQRGSLMAFSNLLNLFLVLGHVLSSVVANGSAGVSRLAHCAPVSHSSSSE
jgi:hypothetical protein